MKINVTKSVFLLLFVFSGIAGLIYQLVWTRMLVLVFGNTVYATSTVLSAFMAGLGAGSYFLGRYIDRREPDLIRVYAFLEAGIGVFALILPFLITLSGPVYASVFRSMEENLWVVNIVRFIICFLLIFIPTFLMGGTLPVLVKYFMKQSVSLGYRTGLLYGLNTLGGVAGSIICGFFLLRFLGMNFTNYIAVTINLAVAFSAWLISRKHHVIYDHETLSRSVIEKNESYNIKQYKPAIIVLIMTGAGISGFCSLSYEVLWTRMLSLFLNNTVYSFTAILSVFLTGIAVGSLIYSRFLAGKNKQVRLFILIQIATGLLSFITPYVLTMFYYPLFSSSNDSLIILKIAAVMLFPAILMGIALPLAIHICRRKPRQEGQSVGNVYAVNTIGSILGAFAGGFILIPFLGIQQSLTFLSLLNLLAAAMVFIASLERRESRLSGIAVIIILFPLVMFFSPVSAIHRLYEKKQPHAGILSYKEGLVANVTVYDFYKNGYRDLFLNNVEEASSRLWHVQLFKLLGVLPVLMNDDAGDALMIAFGAGMSSGTCATQVKSLDCVELNPDICEVAEIFRHENRNVIHNPAFRLIVNDGRNHLYLTSKKYSLIISDATNPMAFDSWTLYTQEFYTLCREKLKPGGVFCQWLPVPLSGDAVKIILKTFQSVFPHASFWVIHGSSQCLMLATPERLNIDFDEFSRRLPGVLKSTGMDEYGITTPAKFLSFFCIGEDKLKDVLKGFDKINSDDLPVAQFYGALDQEGIQTTLSVLSHHESIAGYLSNIPSGQQAIKANLDAYVHVNRMLNKGFLRNSFPEFEKAFVAAQELSLGTDENIKCMLGYDDLRKKHLEENIGRYPEDHISCNNRGLLYFNRKEFNSAIDLLEKAIRFKPDYSAAYFNLISACIQNKEYDRASELLLKLKQINPAEKIQERIQCYSRIIPLVRMIDQSPDVELYNRLGREYLKCLDIISAASAFFQAALLQPQDNNTLLNLADLYMVIDMKEKAVSIYNELLRLNEGNENMKNTIRYFISLTEMKPDDFTADGKPHAAANDSIPEYVMQGMKNALRQWNDYPEDGSVSRENLIGAAREFEKIINKDKERKYQQAYFYASFIYESLGEYDKAAAILRLLNQPASHDEVIKNNIERLNLLEKLQHGNLSQQEEVKALNQTGYLFWTIGEYDRSVEYFKKAIQKDTEFALVWANIGNSYLSTGQYSKAIEALRKAVQFGFENEAMKQELKALEMRYGAAANDSLQTTGAGTDLLK